LLASDRLGVTRAGRHDVDAQVDAQDLRVMLDLMPAVMSTMSAVTSSSLVLRVASAAVDAHRRAAHDV
jgi:hypothetical protein